MITSFAEEIAEDHKIDSESADDLLKDITVANRKPNHAETVFFQQKMGWDDIRVRDQLRRMHSVLRNQAIAGCEADRQAAQDECKTSADVLSKEEPKLTAKIAELQSKLASLERDARLSEKRVEEQSQAVLQLRELVPTHVRDFVNQAVGTIAHTLRREVLDAESRIHELQCCTTPSKYQNQPLYLEALKRSFREAITDHVEGRSLTYRLAPAWPGIRIAIEAELAELQSKLPGLQALYDDAVRQAELPLDFYSDPKNSES